MVSSIFLSFVPWLTLILWNSYLHMVWYKDIISLCLFSPWFFDSQLSPDWHPDHRSTFRTCVAMLWNSWPTSGELSVTHLWANIILFQLLKCYIDNPYILHTSKEIVYTFFFFTELSIFIHLLFIECFQFFNMNILNIEKSMEGNTVPSQVPSLLTLLV